MSDNEQTISEFPPPPAGTTLSHLPFFVVGLGASAGGIEALLRFFEQMPAANDMAFVVVLHLSPDHESSIAEILQTRTQMPVTQVTETVKIEQHHVYVIPPGKDLLMNDGMLQPVPTARARGTPVGIDVFLRTLAEMHRERAVGVILSGAGSDGTLGLARIKEFGGLTIAQAPDDAEYDSMPRTAINSNMVDIVLPVVDIPQKLLEWSRNAKAIQLPSAEQPEENHPLGVGDGATISQDETTLEEIMAILRHRTGHDFSYYKRASVLRRLERRLQVNALPNIVAYRDYLNQHDDEAAHLLQDLLISVTNFFRDRAAFEALERDIIPSIFAKAAETEQIRAWSAGCATGEEAYSLAMLLCDQNALEEGRHPIQVFGSDIDEAAIHVARRGLYPDSIITDVAPARLRQHFEREGKYVCVKKSVREKVLFASHNLLRDPPFSNLHLISCRNLLIYLNRDMQNEVFKTLHYALQPGGYLFLGSAESADSVPKLFVSVNKKHRIYQAVPAKASFSRVSSSIITGEGARKPVEGIRKSSERRLSKTEELHQAMVNEYSPPSLLIDQHGDLLYATKHAGQFLHHPAGETSINIMSIVRPDLQSELRTALFLAKQSQQAVETPPVAIRLDDRQTSVRIVVTPGQNQYAATGLTLLMFVEVRTNTSGTMALPVGQDNPAALHLQEELQHTREQLRVLSEQYETALQDLKSSNEEFQATNEELRSTAEELEASKDELQSINEELLTSNLEWKRRVDEMAKDSDDLQNFLAATDIAIVFIDRDLRIMRFTEPCKRLFNVIATDVGRSLLDITHHIEYSGLRQDIEQVLASAELVEREVRSTGGKWHIVRLLPYRNADESLGGVVLTVIDVTRRKAAEDRVRLGEERLRLVAASTRDYAIYTLDESGVVTSWNRGATYLFGYSEGEMLGQSADILDTPENKQHHTLADALRRASDKGRVESDQWRIRKDGSRVFCNNILSPLVDADMPGFVIIARDLTRMGSEQLK